MVTRSGQRSQSHPMRRRPGTEAARDQNQLNPSTGFFFWCAPFMTTMRAVPSTTMRAVPSVSERLRSVAKAGGAPSHQYFSRPVSGSLLGTQTLGIKIPILLSRIERPNAHMELWVRNVVSILRARCASRDPFGGRGSRGLMKAEGMISTIPNQFPWIGEMQRSALVLALMTSAFPTLALGYALLVRKIRLGSRFGVILDVRAISWPHGNRNAEASCALGRETRSLQHRCRHRECRKLSLVF